MSRFSRIATIATLVIFIICCFGAEFGSTDGTSVDYAEDLDDASSWGQEGITRREDTKLAVDLVSPIGLDEPVHMMSGVTGPQEAKVPIPKVVGLKSAVLGLVIMSVLLAGKAILLRFPEDSQLKREVAWATDRIDRLSDNWNFRGQNIDLLTLLLFGGMALATSGISDLLNSFILRHGQAGIYSLPPVRGVGCAAGGFIIMAMVLTNSILPGLLLVSLPSIAVGTLLIVYSECERRKHLKARSRERRHTHFRTK